MVDLETQKITRLVPGRVWSPDSKKLASVKLLGYVYKGKFYPKSSPELKKAIKEKPKLLDEAEEKQGIRIFDITTGEEKIIYTGVYKGLGSIEVHAWLPSDKIVFTEPEAGAEDPWKYKVSCVIKSDGSEKKIIKKGSVDMVCILKNGKSKILRGRYLIDEDGNVLGDITELRKKVIGDIDLSKPLRYEGARGVYGFADFESYFDFLNPISPSGDKGILAVGELGHYGEVLKGELFIIDLDGKTSKQITFTPHLAEDGGSWSPSGDKIAYIPQNEANIYVIFLKKKQ